ncbi:hypothetical protein [Nocardia xishanensis]
MSTVAAIAQLLIAAAFSSIPMVRHRYGAAAKAAAEAELNRQGVRPGVLAEHGMRFDAGGHETWAPLSIANELHPLENAPEDAAEALGLSESLRGDFDAGEPRLTALVTTLTDRLGAETYQSAYRRGANRPAAEALERLRTAVGLADN